jgi:hypothetical protein
MDQDSDEVTHDVDPEKKKAAYAAFLSLRLTKFH